MLAMLWPNLKPPEAVIVSREEWINQLESLILIGGGGCSQASGTRQTGTRQTGTRQTGTRQKFGCDSSLFASKVTNTAF
jgi:hypothetical protein